MAITSVSDWDTSHGSNAEIDGESLAEGTTRVPAFNNISRKIMAQVASYTRRGTLASAATLNLDSVDTLFLNVSGTATITAVTLANTHVRFVRATGAFTLTAASTLLVNGSATVNYVASANDLLMFIGASDTVVSVHVLGSSLNSPVVGASLLPAANDGAALGASGTAFSDLFLATGGVIDWNAGDVTVTHSANALAFAGASSGYSFDAVVAPASSDGAALGSASLMWSDAFFASGAAINFNNGDVTVTHSTNTLTFGGASSGYAFTGGPVVPATNDAAALGTTSLGWSDVFLATGAVINYANGNWVATHTSGILTVGTGDLRVTTAGTNTASVVTVGGTQTLTNKTLTSAVVDTGLEVGHASDSTLARASAGMLTVEGRYLSLTPVFSSKTDNYTLTAADHGTVIQMNAASKTITGAAASLPAGFEVGITINSAANAVTFVDSGSDTNMFGPGYGSAASVTCNVPRNVRWFVVSGSNWFETRASSPEYIAAGSGSVSAPTITFGANPDTGIFYDATANSNSGGVAFTNDGTRSATISQAAIIAGTVGSAWSPGAGTQDGCYMQVDGTLLASKDGAAPTSFRRRSSDGGIVNFYRDTSAVGSIQVTTSSTSYATSSDERIKENFADFDSGAIIDAMTMYGFDFKAGGSGFGVKAQAEANAMVPDFVIPGVGDPGDDGFIPWSADYSKLVPILFREVQSLRARLAAVEAD